MDHNIMKIKKNAKQMKEKKAAIFTLDATLAIVLTLIAFLSINGYFTRLSYNKVFLAQPAEIASDLTITLAHEKYLQDFYLDNVHFFHNTVEDMYGTSTGSYYGNGTLEHYEHNYRDYWFNISRDGSYIIIPQGFTDDFYESTPYSISAWINLRSYGQSGGPYFSPIVGQLYRRGLVFGIEDDGELFLSMGGFVDSSTINSDTIIDLDSWHHVVATFDGIAVRFYIDGVADLNNPQNPGINLITSPNDYLYIGYSDGNLLGGDQPNNFDGFIDDVRIFDYALDETEVRNLNATNASITDGLTSLYNFDVRTNAIDSLIDTQFPVQYNILYELYANNTRIGTGQRPALDNVVNLIAGGDYMIAVEDQGNIIELVDVDYYSWTKNS